MSTTKGISIPPQGVLKLSMDMNTRMIMFCIDQGALQYI